MKPLAVDIFCGLGGWSEGLIAEGWNVVGFDIERHVYGEHRYPAQLVLQDVLTIHGLQFKDAQLIVASPPCQAYSYRAMPWSRAKALPPPDNSLFDACFRIQREACEAAGRHIPMVVENVRGAQKWVGRAKWNFGSFYLWGDVPALMPVPRSRETRKKPKDGSGNQLCVVRTDQIDRDDGIKVTGIAMQRNGHEHTRHLTNQAEHEGVKNGGDWFNSSQPSSARSCLSKSNARKAASAQIAKIPIVLARWIASAYFPHDEQTS